MYPLIVSMTEFFFTVERSKTGPLCRMISKGGGGVLFGGKVDFTPISGGGGVFGPQSTVYTILFILNYIAYRS